MSLHSAGRAHGLLLLRGAPDAVVAWARRGVAGVAVAPLPDGWTAVLPAEARTELVPPYDDPLALLLSRSVPGRLRAAVGLGATSGQALVTVFPARWRAVQRWLAWQPGRGLVSPGGLPAARLRDLVAVAGVGDPRATANLADVLHDPAGDASTVLQDVLTVLGLPGGELLAGAVRAVELPGVVVVEPDARQVARFSRSVHEEDSWRDETRGRQ